jgi:hypothetical protein
VHHCPECKAITDLKGIGLPVTGRLVSCGVCGGIWRAFQLPVSDPVGIPAVEAQIMPPLIEAAPPSAEAERRPRNVKAMLAVARRVAIGFAVFTVIVGALLSARDYLAVWLPSSRALFAALGKPAAPPEVTVELVSITPVDGGQAFHVTYEIINDTALSRPLPTVCATGRDASAERLFLRCFPGDPQGIPSRGTRRFTFIAADLAYPLADLDLDLSFK